jgi:hypothetical protein
MSGLCVYGELHISAVKFRSPFKSPFRSAYGSQCSSTADAYGKKKEIMLILLEKDEAETPV